jgi:hypothetical protein
LENVLDPSNTSRNLVAERDYVNGEREARRPVARSHAEQKTLLEVGDSTPSEQPYGIAAKAPFAKLGKYEINVRAFHPNKNLKKIGVQVSRG